MFLMTLDDCYDYVDEAAQAESELRAEYGSGCVSLGYDPYDWAPAYEGYRTSDDVIYRMASLRIEAAQASRPSPFQVVGMITVDVSDDLPF